MQTFYYSLRRKLVVAAVVAFAGSGVFAQGSSGTAEGSKSGSVPMHAGISDSHEGVTIGVEPWTTASRYKEKFPKKSPFSKGIVAIHVNIRNDNNDGLKVNLESVRLLVTLGEDNRQQLAPLTADDVADAVTLKSNGKDPTAKRSPLPIPLPTTGAVKSGRDSHWTELRDACQEAGVPSNVIAGHSSVEGLLYFDVRGELDLLQNAHLYLPNIAKMADNEPISYFDIALGPDSSN